MSDRKTLANAIRCLAQDAVEKANSGHPGMPMGMADIAEVLWRGFLKHNPKNPNWFNRDRFVLSNGHGSMLQYALLHLTGYDVSIDDLKAFRQLHSKTPGHPEYGDTPGVETTTGPLGQGLANAVGMALAEKLLAAEFNHADQSLIDYHTYVFVGDGCLMEGVSHEACSLAGVWGLGKLIAFWDNNGISIDGEVADWFADDTPARFKSYGWQVIENVDGHDAASIEKAIIAAQKNTTQPTLICCKTIIGYGAPTLAGTAKVHGSPLGADENAKAKAALSWAHEAFVIPETVYEAWDATAQGAELEAAWVQQKQVYQAQYPDALLEFERRINGVLPENFNAVFENFIQQLFAKPENIATRKASGNTLEAIAPHLPECLGGSADLTGSNNTNWPACIPLKPTQFKANYIHYGVREFGMSAIMNGLALNGGFIPFGGTFLVFQTYCANATRMSALMKQRVIYIFTHDSIGLGEDGPTHQPVNELQTLRTTPNMHVWRPCDAVETAVAWQAALEKQHGPTSLILSRQSLPQLEHSAETVSHIRRGAYIVYDSDSPKLIIMATGSEVSLALEAAKQLSKEIAVRVVSMPSMETFLAQDAAYQEKILPSHIVCRLAIEAANSSVWYRFVGLRGAVIGLDRFGVSAPASDAFAECGFTVDNVMNITKQLVGK